MPKFLVKGIIKGKEQDYRDYWVDGKGKSRDGRKIKPDELIRSDLIDAKNKTDAGEKFLKKYPDVRVESAERL